MTLRSLGFGAQLDEWVKKVERREELVFKESTQRVFTEMQTPVGEGGNMPVDTGFMRNSARASTEAPVPIDPAARPVKPPDHQPGTVIYPYRDGDVTLTIVNASLGETIYITYTAAYARVQEFRRGFVRLAAQNWKKIVAEVIRDAKDRVK